MANAGAVVCGLVVAMDVLAGILGIKAEVAKDKHSSGGVCREMKQSTNAFDLALASAVLLALAHVTSNLLGGCTCICSMDELEQSSSNRQLWFACLIFSWVVAAVGLPMLIIGMLENSKSRGSCAFLHQHLLLIGGALCFFHGLLCVAFYVSSVVSFEKQRNGNEDRL